MSQEAWGPAASIAQLIQELERYSREWTRRTAGRSDPELLEITYRLFTDLYLLKRSIERFETDHEALDPLPMRIHRFMLDNLHQGLTLRHLAQFLGYSEKYCSDLFRTHMGQSFSCYLRESRVMRSKELLAGGGMPIREIAQRLGFSDQYTFSHFFKKTVGSSPRQFRQAARDGAARKPAQMAKEHERG